VVESSGLLNRRTGLNLYRGFKSHPLRHFKGLQAAEFKPDPSPAKRVCRTALSLLFISTHRT
jgi:hypothetical protein